MKKRHLIIALGVLAIGITSCNKNETVPAPVQGTDSIVALSNDYLDNQKQTFVVDASVAQVIYGTQGTQIQLSGNNFTNASGNPITGNVTVELIEFYKQSSMILANKVTLSNTNGQIEPLSSGGEFYIEVTQNGTPVTIQNPLNVTTAPVNNPVGNMQLFDGTVDQNGNILWDTTGTGNLGIDTVSSGYGFPFDDSYDWVNCDYFWSNTAPQTSVTVNLPSYCDGTNTHVYCAFITENAVTSLSTSTPGIFGTASYYSLPEGMSMYIIVVTDDNGQLKYAAQQTTIVTNHVETIPTLINVATLADLETILDGIL